MSGHCISAIKVLFILKTIMVKRNKIQKRINIKQSAEWKADKRKISSQAKLLLRRLISQQLEAEAGELV